MTGLYILTNKINNKKYVGQSMNVKQRLIKHQSGWDQRMLIDVAIKKYGWENFLVETIELPIEKLDEEETRLISEHNSISPNGYNLDSGGNLNKQHTEETKRKIAEAVSGANHYLFGKHPSEETKQKMSESKSGEKNFRWGVHLSDDVKQKISNSHKGKHHTEESKKKMSAQRKGRPSPMEGKVHSEETRQKMSQSRKRYLEEVNGRST